MPEPMSEITTVTGHLDRPGRRVMWRRSGPADAPPLLWFHGSTGSARTAPSLDGVQSLSYDRPGFGGSDLLPSRDLVSDAADVEALLDWHGIARVRLLAFSGGAATAYAVAARLRDRVEHLGVLSGATWPTTPPPTQAALQAAAAALQADPRAAVDRLVIDAPLRDSEVLANPLARQALVDGALDAFKGGGDGWVNEALLIRTAWPFDPGDIRVPVTLWHGAEDVAVPLAAAETVATALPEARLHVLPQSGHLGWMTEARTILGAVMDA